MNWYALYVRSNTEHLVAARLERAKVEAYYPHLVVTSPRRKRSIQRKFFPGYVFARLDLDIWAPGGQLPEMVRIVGRGSEPEPIPDTEIDTVQRMVSDPAQGVIPTAYMAVGDLVTIERGPFRGLEGFVVFLPGDKVRVVVSLSMGIGSISTAEMDIDMLSIRQRASKAA